ncbi:MAG: hypothetical protein DSZ29_06245 [Aquificaceae bacterium]|nr:MAG: hypothetical protein DSZ29_06245 [Aquificaceae bacterium]
MNEVKKVSKTSVMKMLHLVFLSSLAIGTVSFSSNASANWFTPHCTSGVLKVKPRVGRTDQYQCKRTVNRTPSCPAGYTKKTDPLGKDKCEKFAIQVKPAVCKLGVLDNKNNWRIHRQNGADYCTHKTKNKGQKPMKCTGGGYSLSIDNSGNRDRCVKSSGKVTSVVTCRAGETHKKNGVDVCQSVTVTRPAF